MASSGNKYGGTGTPTGAGALSAVRSMPQVGAGVPSHVAPEGTPYWDVTNNALYQNNDGSTGWTKVGPFAAGVTDHGALTGLGDDDHPQYATDTDLATHAGAADPHAVYRLESADHSHASTGLQGGVLTTAALPAAVKTEMVVGWLDPTNASTTVSKITLGPMPFAGTFVKATIKTNDGETNGATAQLVDIHKQLAADENTDTSTTVFTTQSNRPTITNTNKAGSTTTFDVATFAKGDYLRIFSDQLGTGLTSLLCSIEVTIT